MAALVFLHTHGRRHALTCAGYHPAVATMVQKARIPLEELAALPTLYHFEVSNGGDKVAYYSDSSGRIELYILDLATKAVTQLSHGEVPRALRSFFIWDPTDSYLVFAKDNAG